MRSAVTSQSGREAKTTWSKISKLKQQHDKHIVRQFDGKKLVNYTTNSYKLTLKGHAVGNLLSRLKAELDKLLLTKVTGVEDLVKKYELVKSYESRVSFDKEKGLYLMRRLPLLPSLVDDVAVVQKVLVTAGIDSLMLPRLNVFFKEQVEYCMLYLKQEIELITFQSMLSNKLHYDMVEFMVPHFKRCMDAVVPFTKVGTSNGFSRNLLFLMLDKKHLAPLKLIQLIMEAGLCHPKYNTVFKTKQKMEADTRQEEDVMIESQVSCLALALFAEQVDTYEYLRNRWNAKFALSTMELSRAICITRKAVITRFIQDFLNQIKREKERLDEKQELQLRSALFSLTISMAHVLLEDTVNLMRDVYQSGPISFDVEIDPYSNYRIMDLYLFYVYRFYTIVNSDIDQSEESQARKDQASLDVLRAVITEFKWDVNQQLRSSRDTEPLISIIMSRTGFTFDMVKLMIQHGADLRLTGTDGSTPLHNVTRVAPENLVELMELAVQHGVTAETINLVPTQYESTVLDVIMSYYDQEVVEKVILVLQKHGINALTADQVKQVNLEKEVTTEEESTAAASVSTTTTTTTSTFKEF